MTEISRETVEELEAFLEDELPVLTDLVNFSRDRLGEAFDEDIDSVSEEDVERELQMVLADDDRALNLAALYRLGVDLDVENDYAGFVVDELIGRRIAASVADADPEVTLAEATFHYLDVYTDEVVEEEDRSAGYDDVVAGFAAGVQTRLPGWNWQEEGL